MTRQEKIDKIYETIADKTLSFGCVLKGKRSYRIVSEHYCDDVCIPKLYRFVDDGDNFGYGSFEGKKVTGHPVTIGDVLDWYRSYKKIEEKDITVESYDRLGYEETEYGSFVGDLLFHWVSLKKPIEYQPISTINRVYDLVK